MIFGIGTDIVETRRFKKWIENPSILNRFFASEEQFASKTVESRHENALCQHYAVRFAAKEAFSEFLNDTNLDSRQIYFVNQIVEYIVHNGMLKDLSVLQESPFTDKGSVAEIFTDMTVWMGI